MTDRVLYMFTVYRSPRDFPGKYVVRRFAIVAGNLEPVPDANTWAVVNSLPMARASLPDGLHNIRREPGDEPHIVETWI